LLLAIRGHGNPRGPTIGDVADDLLLRHHSVVGLVDRADTAGLVRLICDDRDHRLVRLQLTPEGARRLEGLSAVHVEELKRLAPQVPGVWLDAGPAQSKQDSSTSRRRAGRNSGAVEVEIARRPTGPVDILQSGTYCSDSITTRPSTPTAVCNTSCDNRDRSITPPARCQRLTRR